MKNQINVMMLAAGMGTRLRPLTDKHPKPCVPFLNVPMGLYQFRYLENMNIASFTVNTFHLPDQIKNLYQNQPYYLEKINFSDESLNKTDSVILGGAGGVKKAKSFFKEGSPILMMNADEIYFASDKNFLQEAIEFHNAENNLATVIVIKHPEAGKKFGAIWTQNQTVKDISKKASHADLEAWHSIGLILLNYDILKLIYDNKELNIFYDILLPELKNNNVKIFPILADWYETGNPNDFFSATHDVMKKYIVNQSNSDLLKFINQYDESKMIINNESVSLISQAKIDKLVKLKGCNVISSSFCGDLPTKLENSILFNNESLNSKYFQT